MPMRYTEQDRSIIGQPSSPSRGLLTSAGSDDSSGIYLHLESFGVVEFQFPPKILSDNRKAKWAEGFLPGTEPVAVYETSGAREFSISFTYIVDSYQTENFDVANPGDGAWSIRRIKNQIQKLRGYYSQVISLDSSSDSRRENLLVMFSYPFYTGTRPWSCRMISTDVKHGETLVGTGKNIFPLRTDVSLEIRLWSTGVQEFEDDFKEVQNINGLMSEPSLSDLWY